MALLTFAPPQNPNRDYGYEVEPQVRSTNFGDGYKQRFADGLNGLGRDLTLMWGPVSPANADAIEDFFKARGGVEPFLYTTPLDALRGLPARRYVCKKWARRTTEINADTVSAQFEEDFGTAG